MYIRFAKKLKMKHLVAAFSFLIFVILICQTYVQSERNIDKTYDLPLCEPQQHSSYNDVVDIRILVLTLNRPPSLRQLFEGLDELELDNHSAAVEIWIDRNRKTNEADEETVKVASQFRWRGGPTRVHVHPTHVGLYGQWIDTWRPRDDSDNELALILEDDLSISKYAYRWVRAVFRAYGHRKDFAGASLTGYQRENLSTGRPKGPMAGPKNHTVFMYKCFGWWGFAPKPMHWKLFQNWYHTHKPTCKSNFHPYVPGALPSQWYKVYKSRGQAWTMWTIWFVYYMHVNQLYSVYSNLGVYTGSKQTSFSVNRIEVGLHHSRKGHADVSRLLSDWKEEYVLFPNEPVRLDWDRSYVE